jgi:hypothetical protein
MKETNLNGKVSVLCNKIIKKKRRKLNIKHILITECNLTPTQIK